MKFLLGVIVGIFLAVGVAYVHDASLGADRDRDPRAALVNWEVFSADARHLREEVSSGWSRMKDELRNPTQG